MECCVSVCPPKQRSSVSAHGAWGPEAGHRIPETWRAALQRYSLFSERCCPDTIIKWVFRRPIFASSRLEGSNALAWVYNCWFVILECIVTDYPDAGMPAAPQYLIFAIRHHSEDGNKQLEISSSHWSQDWMTRWTRSYKGGKYRICRSFPLWLSCVSHDVISHPQCSMPKAHHYYSTRRILPVEYARQKAEFRSFKTS